MADTDICFKPWLEEPLPTRHHHSSSLDSTVKLASIPAGWTGIMDTTLCLQDRTTQAQRNMHMLKQLRDV